MTNSIVVQLRDGIRVVVVVRGVVNCLVMIIFIPIIIILLLLLLLLLFSLLTILIHYESLSSLLFEKHTKPLGWS